MKVLLYKPFENWYHGGNIFLYSDPHFADEEMKSIRANYISDEEQIKRINSKVGKNDTIIFLGDIGDVEWIKKVKGYKVLIKGNHDKGESNYERVREEVKCFDSSKLTRSDVAIGDLQKGFSIRIEDNKLFDEVYRGSLTINDKIILSHQPRPTLPYEFNIHGHVHGLDGCEDEHHFNCCAERINYTPVRLDEIVTLKNVNKIKTIHRYYTDIAKEGKNSEVL